METSAAFPDPSQLESHQDPYRILGAELGPAGHRRVSWGLSWEREEGRSTPHVLSSHQRPSQSAPSGPSGPILSDVNNSS